MHKVYFKAFAICKGSISKAKCEAFENIDFTGNGGGGTSDPSNGGEGNPANENDPKNSPDINDNNSNNDINNGDNKDNSDNNPDNNNPDKDKDNNPDNSSTGKLEEGSTLQIGDDTYTVDKDGNVIDKDGNVFKEAKDVDEWIKSFDLDNTDDTITIDTIKAALDTEITDENGNPVEFENTPEGVKSYVDKVIELKSNDIQQAAVNKIFNDNPILRQFVDYLTVNNGDYRGFGERPDRSNITIDPENQSQQEAIIKVAAAEFGNTTLNDSYIKYLKDNDALFDEAKLQLKNLQEADKYRLEQESARAREIEAEQQAQAKAYWDNVKQVIDGRNIGGYKLPDTFIRTINGQKTTATPDDFFAYLYKGTVDENGIFTTEFQREQNALSDEDFLNRQLLDAWLLFSHGSYKDLVDMAVREENVKTLKLRAKENNTRGTIKITKPTKKSNSIDDIILS